MKLSVYKLHDDAAPIRPGRPERDWMSATNERFAYRCLPLSIANTSGYEVLSPFGFTIFWNGGDRKEDIRFEVDGNAPDFERFCVSHFAHGIVTFHVGYLIRTPLGFATLVSGPPNQVKHGIQALSGLVETDWLPFPFTMNWAMTGPGKVRFEKDEPVCFLMPVDNRLFEAVEPEMTTLAEAPDLAAEYEAWMASRATFLDKLAAGDPGTVREAWQRHYFKGVRPDAPAPVPSHVHKRRMKPVEDQGIRSRTERSIP